MLVFKRQPLVLSILDRYNENIEAIKSNFEVSLFIKKGSILFLSKSNFNFL